MVIGGGFGEGSLAMTYFLTRKCNIIGAVSFHGPVREGKGWVRNAMVAKRNWLPRRIRGIGPCARPATWQPVVAKANLQVTP